MGMVIMETAVEKNTHLEAIKASPPNFSANITEKDAVGIAVKITQTPNKVPVTPIAFNINKTNSGITNNLTAVL